MSKSHSLFVYIYISHWQIDSGNAKIKFISSSIYTNGNGKGDLIYTVLFQLFTIKYFITTKFNLESSGPLPLASYL